MFLLLLSVITILAMIASITPVAEWISKSTGWTVDKVKSVARTVIGTAIGLSLVSWGVAALAVPILGVALVVIGLVLVAYSLWPLFRPSSSTTATNASFDSKGPLSIFG